MAARDTARNLVATRFGSSSTMCRSHGRSPPSDLTGYRHSSAISTERSTPRRRAHFHDAERRSRHSRRCWKMAAVIPFLAALLMAAPAPHLEHPHACPDAQGFTCSTLRVPLDHARPARGTLSLAVAAEDGNGRRPFLLLLTGGPGQP